MNKPTLHPFDVSKTSFMHENSSDPDQTTHPAISDVAFSNYTGLSIEFLV